MAVSPRKLFKWETIRGYSGLGKESIISFYPSLVPWNPCMKEHPDEQVTQGQDSSKFLPMVVGPVALGHGKDTWGTKQLT